MAKKEKIPMPVQLDSERPKPISAPPPPPECPKEEEFKIRCYDFRSQQPDPPKLSEQKHRIIRGEVAKRHMTSVRTVVIHQTACIFGVSQGAIDAAKGNRELALARRMLNVAAHCVALRDGFYVLTNPFSWYVWHANALNEESIGLEIEGLYPGLKDDPATAHKEDVASTWGGKPMALTDLAVATAREALKHMVESARAEGAPLENIRAHRQSSVTRRSDPGQEIWERVVLEYAVPVLKLKTDTNFSVGGRPIPLAWDPAGHGPY